MKYQTQGVDPKIPAMAAAIIISFIIGQVLIELPLEVTVALSTLISVAAGYFAPAPRTVAVPKGRS